MRKLQESHVRFKFHVPMVPLADAQSCLRRQNGNQKILSRSTDTGSLQHVVDRRGGGKGDRIL
jgi:hypothetical protein